MAEAVRVLVYGSISDGVCDFYRLGMYRDRLLALGVEMRTWGDFNDYIVRVPPAYRDRLSDAVRDGVAEIDRTPIDWADVILFRRWYSVAPCCEQCDTSGPPELIAAHCLATGHRPNTPDQLLPLLLATIENRPEALRGRAVMYETDDDLLGIGPWHSEYRRILPDRPIIERLMRRADLVTVTTPVLERRARSFNDSVRVVRNAVDPSWYADSPGRDAVDGGPRILYYGSEGRLRDYQVCREAVDLAASRAPGARRIWLGARADGPARGMVDEFVPYVHGVPAFARALAAARPDVGVAPVVGEDFDRAKSELHWLEYSMAGAATIASRTMGGGPYDVLRHGVDGLLARNRAEWRDGLRRLTTSPALREDMAARARERVLREYDPDERAVEWADAYRWAAEHGGRGARPRIHALGGSSPGEQMELAAEPAVNLAYRQRTRREAVEAVERLAALRGDGDVCWPAGADVDPLVSVIIPTYNRGRLIVDRAIVSTLAQTYQNFEIVIVGDDATPETIEAARSVRDPRIRFENLIERAPKPADPELAWYVSGSRPYNRGLELARGQWICPLPDDDELTPDHIEVLLAAAVEHRLEFVYGQSWMEFGDGSWVRMGEWPPRYGGFAAGSMLYSAGLSFLRLDEECWRENEANDWNLWRRMVEAGVRMGFIEHTVFRHYVEARHRLKAS